MTRTIFVASFTTRCIVRPPACLPSSPLPAQGDEAHLLGGAEVRRRIVRQSQGLPAAGRRSAPPMPVPVLAGLLADEQLSHYARFGLESNPSPDVDEALRQGAGQTGWTRLVGVINSIGVRRDKQAVDA